MAYAEGTKLSRIETKVLIIDKITPSGHNTDDIERSLRLSRGWDEIIKQAKGNNFNLSKDNFIKINSIIALNEALEVGEFREFQVGVGDYLPPKTTLLDGLFTNMVKNINSKTSHFEKAYDLHLISSRNQYFYGGNKRTSQLIMNGYLISNGLPPITVKPENIKEYNDELLFIG